MRISSLLQIDGVIFELECIIWFVLFDVKLTKGIDYSALKPSIAEVISTVNRRESIKQRRDYYAAKIEELDAELAAIDAAAGGEGEIECGKFRVNKRRRK